MTQYVVVQPGPNTLVPSGPQYGVKYTLTNKDGVRCVFNDDGDADYVGWLSNITGFDSADVREAADDLVGDDGGVHGSFFFGRRPVVLEGGIDPRPDTIERNIRMTRLQRASNAMRSDATLSWMPDGGVQQEIKVRRQQPLRITGAYNKSFQMSLVASDPRIYSSQVKESIILPAVHNAEVENIGTMDTPPFFSISGPATAIEIHNHTTGQFIVFTAAYSITSTQRLDIDVPTRTVKRENGTNVYSQIDFLNTSWFSLVPGVNNIALHATGTSANTALTLRWRDAWV